MKDMISHIQIYILSGCIGLYFFFVRRAIIHREEHEAEQDTRLNLLEKKQAILEERLVNKDDFFTFANQLKDSLSNKIEEYKKDHETRLDEFLTNQDKKFNSLDSKIDSIKKDINKNGD